MKRKFIVIALAILLVLTLTLTACERPKTPDVVEMDIIKGWAGNEEEEVYIMSVAGDTLTIDYEKSGADWAYAKYVLSAYEADDLESINTLAFTGSLNATAGTNLVVLKIEFNGLDPVEIKFEMSSTAKTYEWDLSEYDLTKALRLLVFADAGGMTGEGTITFSSFKLTSEEVNKDNEIVPYNSGQQFDTEQAINTYTSGDTFAANAEWRDSGAGVYTVSGDASAWVVAYDKLNESYPAVQALVGGDLSSMKKIMVTVNGAVGTRIMIKPWDSAAHEKVFVLTGGDDVFELDITPFTIGENAIDWTVTQKVTIIIEPGTQSVTGTFTIKDLTFSNVAYVPPVAPQAINTYVEGETFAANAEWRDGGNLAYTCTLEDNAWNIEYNKTDGYQFVKALVAGNFSSFKKIIFTVQGTEGKSMLVKPFDIGANEMTVVFTGEEQIVEISLASFGEIDWTAASYPIIIFAEAGSNTSGSFIIKDMTFSQSDITPPEDLTVRYESGSTFFINKNWQDVDGGKYTITTTAEKTTIAYGENISWSALLVECDAGEQKFNTLTITVKGIAGHSGIFKLEYGNNQASEYKFENATAYTGETQTFTIVVPEFSGEFKLRVFTNFAGSDAGSIEITKAALTNVIYPDAADASTEIAQKFVNDGGSGRFAFVYGEDGTEISYTTANWDNFVTFVDLGEGGYDKVSFTVQGMAGHTAIFNVAGTEYKFENDNKFNGEEQKFDISVSGKTGLVVVRIFFDWDAWEDFATNPNASVLIKSASLVKGEPIVDPDPQPVYNDAVIDTAVANWAGDVTAPYTLTYDEGVLTVAYAKNNQAYSNVNISPENLAEYKFLKITFVGRPNAIHIFKLENGGTVNEQRIQCTGAEQVVYVEIKGNSKFVIMAEGDTATVNGTLVINKLEMVQTGGPIVVDTAVANWAGDVTNPYTLTYNEGVLTVAYNKNNQAYSNINISPAGMVAYKVMKIVFTGEAGAIHIFKIEGGAVFETRVTCTGNEEELYMLVNGNSKFVLMAEGDTATADGTLLIKSISLYNEDDRVPAYEDPTALAFFGDVGTNYTVTPASDSVTIAYNKSAEWTFVGVELADMGLYPYMQIVVNGTAGQKVMFKVEGGTITEYVHTLTDGTDFVYIPIKGCTKLIMFAEPGNANAVTGEFVIHNIILCGTKIEAPLPDTAVVDTAVANWAGDVTNPYTLTYNEGVLTAAYDKSNQAYSNINISPENMAKYEYLKITFTGNEGAIHIFKVENGGTVNEQRVTCTGEEEVFYLEIKDNSRFVIMAEGDAGTAAGTLVINSIELTQTNP